MYIKIKSKKKNRKLLHLRRHLLNQAHLNNSQIQDLLLSYPITPITKFHYRKYLLKHFLSNPQSRILYLIEALYWILHRTLLKLQHFHGKAQRNLWKKSTVNLQQSQQNGEKGKVFPKWIRSIHLFHLLKKPFLIDIPWFHLRIASLQVSVTPWKWASKLCKHLRLRLLKGNLVTQSEELKWVLCWITMGQFLPGKSYEKVSFNLILILSKLATSIQLSVLQL